MKILINSPLCLIISLQLLLTLPIKNIYNILTTTTVNAIVIQTPLLNIASKSKEFGI